MAEAGETMIVRLEKNKPGLNNTLVRRKLKTVNYQIQLELKTNAVGRYRYIRRTYSSMYMRKTNTSRDGRPKERRDDKGSLPFPARNKPNA